MTSIIKAYKFNKIRIDGFFCSNFKYSDLGHYISHETAIDLNKALELTDTPARIGPGLSPKGEIVTGFRGETFLPAVYVPISCLPPMPQSAELISLRKALGKLERALV